MGAEDRGLTSFSDRIANQEKQSCVLLDQHLGLALTDAIAETHPFAETACRPERDPLERLGVRRIAVRKAVDALISEAELILRHGLGAYVAELNTTAS